METFSRLPNTKKQDNNKYRVEEISSLENFKKLRVLWDNLAGKQRRYMPFMCFDWFKMWLEHFLKNNKLRILVVYAGDQPAGVAPFILLRKKFKRMTVEKIELIGNVYSPVRNFIFGDLSIDEKKTCLSKIFDYLFCDSNDWDVIELGPILEEDKNSEILKQVILEKGYKTSEDFCGENWYLAGINYSAEEYVKKRPHGFRNSLRKRRRKLEETGKLDFKMITNNENIKKYMDCYYDVYARSWKKREGIGPTFHRDLAELAAAKGWLRLGFLYFDDVPVATHFCMVSDRVGYFLKVAYDEEYKEYGLGNIIHHETIKYMIDHDKIESIDLGAGSEEFKKFWVSDKREMKRIMVFNRNFKGTCLAIMTNKILPIIRRNEILNRVKTNLMKKNVYKQ